MEWFSIWSLLYEHDGEAQGEPREIECRYKVIGDSMDHAAQLFKNYEAANFYAYDNDESASCTKEILRSL